MNGIDTSGLGPAGKLIARGWTQQALARNSQGRACRYDKRNVACYCAVGAINAAYYHPNEWWGAKDRLMKHLGVNSLIDWNDALGRTHAEVLQAFRETGL